MSPLHSALVVLIGVCFTVFVAAWLAGALYFGVKSEGGLGGRLRDLRRTPRHLVLVAGVCLLMVLVGHTQGFWHHLRYWQPETALLGARLAVASTALLLWARWTLGTMWAGVPLVQDHHELRTEGPYRLVRHPMYIGLIGLVVGGTLACGFGVWIAYAAVTVPWLLRRVPIEDGLMADKFGTSYDAYRARVPALLPRLRPVPAGHSEVGGEQH